MVTVSLQWITLIFVILFLAVRPTIELFVRAPSSREAVTQSQEKKEEIGRMVLHEEELIYRPNERDKPKHNGIFDTSESQQSTSSGKGKKAKRLRRKRAEGTKGSDIIVFPEPQFMVPNPPPCARGGGDTFCEAVDEYPTEHVLRVLRKEPVVVRTFFQDEKKLVSHGADDVQDRIDASDENPLCASQEHTVYPKMAKNAEGNWLFVINHEEYLQGVRVEKCLNSRECSFPASLPSGYRSQCKQKYIYRKLVALNGTGQGVISDSFQFPSCCSCVIKFDHNVAHSRFGGSGGAAAALPLTLPKTTPTPHPLRHKPKS